MSAIVLDTETTGLDAVNHKIIEIAIVDFETDQVLLETYVNPGVFIPEEITKITGITDTDVEGAPSWAEIFEQVSTIVQGADAIIGYNPYFDQGFIDSENMRMATPVKVKWPTIICAKRIWDAYEPREERNLKNAFKRFVNHDGFAAHRALSDVRATREVLRSQMDHFSLHGKSWEEFDPQRKNWWGPSFHVLIDEEAGALVCNFGKNKGKPVHDIEDGFWRWLIEKDFPNHMMGLALKMRELIPLWNESENLRKALWAWAKDSNWRKPK